MNSELCIELLPCYCVENRVVFTYFNLLLSITLCSSGLSCPATDFVEEPFLKDAKSSISKQGLFVVNLVSRSTKIKEMVISRLKR